MCFNAVLAQGIVIVFDYKIIVMKKINQIVVGIIFGVVFVSSTVKAQDAANPLSIEVLKDREALLKENTNLNKLKIKLTNKQAEIPKLEEKISSANERSAKSAVESKNLSTKMNDNGSDQKLAKKASRAAKESYNDARKVQKLADELSATKQKISGLESDIEKLRLKIEKMDQQLKFTSNAN